MLNLGEKINFLTAKKLSDGGLKEINISNLSLYGKFLQKEIKIGEESFPIGTELNEIILSKIIEANI